jgi:hypothetical protein
MPQVVPSDNYSTLPEIVHHFVIPVKKKKPMWVVMKIERGDMSTK